MHLNDAIDAAHITRSEVRRMAQKEIEIILARHLGSYLSTPIFIVDPDGNLLYFNESAEKILGRRFEDTGEMSLAEWSTIFQPMQEDGVLLSPEKLPLVVTLMTQQPAHGSFWIRGLDNVMRHIVVNSYPLIGQAERYLGAVAMFWEKEQP